MKQVTPIFFVVVFTIHQIYIHALKTVVCNRTTAGTMFLIIVIKIKLGECSLGSEKVAVSGFDFDRFSPVEA
jgi:hypothetical protein